MAETEQQKSSKSKKEFAKTGPGSSHKKRRKMRNRKPVSDDEEFLVHSATHDSDSFTVSILQHSERAGTGMTSSDDVNVTYATSDSQSYADEPLREDNNLFESGTELSDNHRREFNSEKEVEDLRTAEAIEDKEDIYNNKGSDISLKIEDLSLTAMEKLKTFQPGDCDVPLARDGKGKRTKSSILHGCYCVENRKNKQEIQTTSRKWKKNNKNRTKLEVIVEEETMFQSTYPGGRDPETIEILEKDQEAKKEKMNKKRKRAKRIAKTAGRKVWKGIRQGWKLMWSGLAMYTLPLGSLDVASNLTKIWSTHSTSNS